jgi:hypothetical protein
MEYARTWDPPLSKESWTLTAEGKQHEGRKERNGTDQIKSWTTVMTMVFE